MKRLFALALCMALLFCLTGCYYDHHKTLTLYGESPVTAVELYDLPLLYAGVLTAYFSDTGEDGAPLMRLPSDRVNDFLAEVTTWQYTDTIIMLPVPQDGPREFHGYAIKVTYENGNWEMFDDAYCVRFDGVKESQELGSVSFELWDALLRQYFGVEANSSSAYQS